MIRRAGGLVLASAVRESDGAALWIKFTEQNAGEDSLSELKLEAELITRLEGDCMLRVVGQEQTSAGPVLVLEAFEGQPLREVCKGAPLPLPEFFRAARALTAAVASVHRHSVIHRCISPGIFYVDGAFSAARLIEFSQATRIHDRARELAARDLDPDSLPWLSPEQTGRLNWAVSYGSDLYALGVIFYELLTGHLPFAARDPLEWVHCHIAILPAAPERIAPEIPPIVSRLVLKLLAKNPADRYLSAAGLLSDLIRAEAAVAQSPQAYFELGADDVRTFFSLPDRVYGRESEFAALSSALSDARTGRNALVLVTGPPGAGKSTLVIDWHAIESASPFLFAVGKYERFEQDQPYFGLRQAVQSICRRISCESPARVAEWKQRIGGSLGQVGRVMTDVFPSLQNILGPQPAVPELPAAEAGNRFLEAFRQLVRGLTSGDAPLVLFLDDMQWADSASLSLINSFLSAAQGGLLLVLGFRDETAAQHEAIASLTETVRTSGSQWQAIALHPLDQENVAALLRDAMPGATAEMDQLAEIVLQKSGGNPFFVRQFLSQLVDEELIYFQEGWRWKEDAIRASKVTENVVAFVASRLKRLSPVAQLALEYGSCFGLSISPLPLEKLLKLSPSRVQEALEEGLDSGALVLCGNDYRFVHDRVREAACTLIPVESLPAMHHEIARLLLAKGDPLETELFEAVRHLAAARPRLDREERLNAGRLNLRAAALARKSAAFGPALDYARSGWAEVDDATWATDAAFAADAGLVLSEALFLNSQQDEFEVLVEELFGRITDRERLVTLHEQKILARSAGSRHAEAIQASYDALGSLDAGVPEADDAILAALLADRAAIEQLTAGGLGPLRNRPLIADARLEATVRILMRMTPDTIMLGRGVLYALVVARAVRICLENGYSPLTPVVFANYAVVESQFTGDADRAYAWAQLAAHVDDAHEGKFFAPTRFIPGWFVFAWKLVVRDCVPVFEAASKKGFEAGDILFGSFSAAAASVFQAWGGAPLTEVVVSAARHRGLIRERVYSADYHCILERQFARCLMGMTSGNTSLADEDFSVAQMEAVKNTRSAHQAGYYEVARLRLAYLFGETDEARSAINAVAPYEPGLKGLLAEADLKFYRAMFLLGTESATAIVSAREAAAWLSHAAKTCPANFRAYELMLEGEIVRAEGRLAESQGLFARAVDEADRGRLPHHAALAAELALRVHLELGDNVAAAAYLDVARRRYTAWGATSRVAHLDEIHRALRSSREDESRVRAHGSRSLDLLSLMKSSQAISGEIVMTRLVDRMMHTILENAGAEWGGLILQEGKSLFVEAIRRADQQGDVELLHVPLEQSELPRSIIEHVSETRQALVLSDAQRDREFGRDPAIVRSRARSVLCAPILRKSALSGIVYLQNDLSSGVFTSDRLEVLQLLSSQIAISLDNARYHEQSLQWERVRRDLESARAIQLSLLPQKLPDASPYSISLRSSACYEVGGDYTDVVILPNGEWIMLVADVAGKGLASAIIASSLRSAFRAIANTGVPLSQLASQLSELHFGEGPEARLRYATAGFLRFDAKTHRLEVVNAGHPPIFLVSANGKARLFEAGAPPIGLLPGQAFPSETAVLQPGDRLLAYTDGLTETRRGDDEFGSERLLELFSSLPFESAEDLIDRIWLQLREFSGNMHPEDDMTALTLYRPEH